MGGCTTVSPASVAGSSDSPDRSWVGGTGAPSRSGATRARLVLAVSEGRGEASSVTAGQTDDGSSAWGSIGEVSRARFPEVSVVLLVSVSASHGGAGWLSWGSACTALCVTSGRSHWVAASLVEVVGRGRLLAPLGWDGTGDQEVHELL